MAKTHYENFLKHLGVDTEDPNIKETPERVTKMFGELLEGSHNLETNLDHIFSKSFPSNYSGIVAQKKIKCFSMCPHHLLPVEYSIDIGIIAEKQMVGLSKFSRAIELLCRRLVLQETLTQDIVDILKKYLNPKGIIVIVRGRHFCMVMRGTEQDVWTTTSAVDGVFAEDIKAKQEFLTL